MKKGITLLSFFICLFSIANAQTTYYWVGGTGSISSPANWGAAASWNSVKGSTAAGTQRATPAANDVLTFDGSNIGSGATGAVYVGSLPTQTVGKLIFQNNANVTFSTTGRTSCGNDALTIATTTGTFNSVAAGTSGTYASQPSGASIGSLVYTQLSNNSPTNVGQLLTTTTTSYTFNSQGSTSGVYIGNILSISQASGFVVNSNCTLNLSAGNAFAIKLLNGASGSVSGTINVTSAGQRIITQDATYAAASGELTFANGSQLNITSTIVGNVFDYFANATNDNVVFQSGSSYNIVPPVTATATLTIGTGANAGKLSMNITNAGTGYMGLPTYTIVTPGTTTGTAITTSSFTITVGGVSGNTTSVGGTINTTSTNQGTSYTVAPTITFSAPTSQGTSGPSLPFPYNGSNSYSCVSFQTGSTFSMNGVNGYTSTSMGNRTFPNFSLINGSTFPASGNLTINGTLQVDNGSTLTLSTYKLISGNLSGTTSGTGTINTASTDATAPIPTGITWSQLINYNSASAQTVVAGTYNGGLNLTGGNRTLSTANPINISGVYTAGAGTITTTSSNVSFSGTSSIASSPTTFNNLTITGGTLTTAASSTLNVNGNLSITGGAFSTGTSSTLNVTGNWSNAGTFTAGSLSSVVFNGTNQSITGTNSFVNFTKSVASAAALTLPAGLTQTFSGNLTLTGASLSNLLTIQSSSSGVPAIFNYNPIGTNNLIYNSIQDITNSNATALNSQYSANVSDNTNLTFNNIPKVWNGSISSSWNTANNWTPTGVPNILDVVQVNKTGTNDIVLDVSPTVLSVTIYSGNSLSLNGNTLTVGSFTNNGTFTAGTGTVIFNADATVSGSSTTSFNNVTINSGVILTGNLNVGGILSLGSTSTSIVSGTITFNGSSLQMIPNSTVYNNLSVNNTAGAVLGSNITVLGNLTLQAGTLADMGNTITLSGNIYGAGTHTSGGFKMSGVSFAAGATSIVLPTAPTYLSINTAVYAAGFDKATKITSYDPNTGTIKFWPPTLTAGNNVTLYNTPPSSSTTKTTALGAYTWTSGNSVTLNAPTSNAFIIGNVITATSGIPTGTIITGYDSITATITLSKTPTASSTFNQQSIGRINALNPTVTATSAITLGDASGNLTIGNISVGNTGATAGATLVTIGNTVDIIGRLLIQYNSSNTSASTNDYIDLNENTLNCHGNVSIASGTVNGGWILKGGSSSSTAASINLYTAYTGNSSLTLRMDATNKYLNSFVTTGYSVSTSASPLTIASNIVVKDFTIGAANVYVNTGLASTPASITISRSFNRLFPVNYGQLVAGGSNSIIFNNTSTLNLPSVNPFGSTFSVSGSTTIGSTIFTLSAPNLNIQSGFTIGNGSLGTVALDGGTTVAAYDGNVTITLSKAAIATTTTQTQFIGSPYTTANNSVSISDIVISGGGTVNLGCNVSFGGSITVSNNSSLNIGANTASFYTDAIITNTGGSISANSTSSLVLGGNASNLSIPSNINALNNLVLNNVNGATLNSSIALSGTLSLLNGKLNNSVVNNITMANATTINISGGTFNVPPVFGTSVNLEYRANSQSVATDNAPDPVAYNTGFEIPTNSSVLNNVSFNAYALSNITINNPGAGYTNPPSITIGNVWLPSTAYTLGTQVTNGGNLYTCSQAGTSSTVNGPLDYGSSITDGSAKWDYVGVAPQAYCKLSGGSVSSIVIMMNGTGYTSVPTITISGVSTNPVNSSVTSTATASAVLTSPTVTLTSNATINGVLNLLNGKLLLSLYNLTIGSSSSAITGANSNSYILTDTTGKLIRTSVPLNTTTVFPMGIVDSSKLPSVYYYYTPLTITNTSGNGSTMSVGARRYFNHSVGDSTQALFLQWSVLGTVATTSNITYQFNTGNQAPDFVVTNSCELGTYKTSYLATQVGVPTSLGGGIYTVSASGLTVPTSGENFYVIGNTGNIVVTATTWTGGAGTNNWNSFNNWDNGVPSGSSIDVIIPNTTIKPTLTATQTLKSLTIASGAVLTLNSPGSLLITRDFTNNGAVSGSGLLTMNGTSLQTVYGNGTTATNFTVNNSGGVAIATGSNKLNITGILTLQSGTLTTNGNLTLKSLSLANTGVLAPYGASGNTGTISGNVTVERYIPKGFRAYRDMAPEVYGAGTINANWQEGATNANSNPKLGYGIFITGSNTADATNAGKLDANGFDYAAIAGLNTQDYTYDPLYTNPISSYGHFKALTNTTSTNLNPFTGYRLLIRGDRAANLYTSPVTNTQSGLAMFDATTLRATGQLITGTVTYSKTNVTSNVVTDNSVTLNSNTNGFSLVANPYVAPVQWGTGTGSNSATTTVYGASSGINGSYWYLDPTSGATGKYIAFNALTGAATVAGSGTYSNTGTVPVSTGYIQPGQAVFVQTTGASPTVVFQETAKAISSTKASVFGTAQLSKIYVSLMKQSTSTTSFEKVDGAAVAFSTSFGNKEYGAQDAIKFSGANDNLFISDKGKNLSIDGRLPATASDAISLKITSPTATAYQLSVDASNYVNNGFEPLLYDAFKNTTKALGTGNTTISFTVDASNAASFSNRFTILFAPSALPVSSIVASAALSNKIATISWNTVGEKNVASYEVEKSADAKNFTAIEKVAAKNTETASYNTTDNSVTTTTYYRIKAVSTTGAISYSNVAKLSTDNRLPSYSLYPNPLKGTGVVNVNLSNVVAGKYTLSIYNTLGQKVSEQTISHTGGSATHAISINNVLAAGVYSVTISEANSKQVVNQSNLSVQP